MAGIKVEMVDKPDRIISYWKKEKKVAVGIIVFGLLFNISMVLGPVWQGRLIDALAVNKSSREILQTALIFVGLILIIQLLRYFKRFYVRRFANCTSAAMRLTLYDGMLHQNMEEFEKENPGNVMTCAVADVDLCVEGMRKFTTEVFDTGVLMVSYIVMLLWYDAKVTLLSVGFIPLAMFLAEKLKHVVYRYTRAYRNKSSEMADITNDRIDNAMLYRIHGADRESGKKYEKQVAECQKMAVRAYILENSLQPVYSVIAMAGIVIFLWQGGRHVLAGELSIGNFTACITIFSAMAVKAGKASKLINSMQKAQVSWQRLKPYLGSYQNAENKPDEIHEYSPQPKNQKMSIKVKDLSFGYEGQENNTLQNISFTAESGEVIGITGPVASGKSTLAKVLTGWYAYEGHIWINEKELSSYGEYERGQIMAFTGHDPELFSDTIRTNITWGEHKNVSEFLKEVSFEKDLEGMKEGVETQIGNGGIRLSGGQQARISLARALAEDRKIMILDDPFSAVDSKTEKEIMKNIRENHRDSILIMVSHRLSSFPEADRIIVLNKSGIPEYGTHQELLVRSELYRELYERQGGAEHE